MSLAALLLSEQAPLGAVQNPSLSSASELSLPLDGIEGCGCVGFKGFLPTEIKVNERWGPNH